MLGSSKRCGWAVHTGSQEQSLRGAQGKGSACYRRICGTLITRGADGEVTWAMSTVPAGCFQTKSISAFILSDLFSLSFFLIKCCVSSVMSNSVTPWTVAHQAPLSMEFSRQEYWSGLLFPSPGDLPNPGITPASLVFRRWCKFSLWHLHIFKYWL